MRAECVKEQLRDWLASQRYEAIDEMLLVLQWFRRRPGAFSRTVSFDEWLSGEREEI